MAVLGFRAEGVGGLKDRRGVSKLELSSVRFFYVTQYASKREIWSYFG